MGALTPIGDVVRGVPLVTERVRELLNSPDFANMAIDEPPVVPPEPPPRPPATLVPARFTEASFDTYRPTTSSQRRAIEAVRQWVTELATGPMLALIGPRGCGKSHLLYAALRVVLTNGRRVYARPWYKLADELRYGGASPHQAKKLESWEVRALLWEHRVVLLDEVRATASTEFDYNELAKFSCWAYDERVAVLLTTNADPLETVMGGPAASRYTEVVVKGPDYRHPQERH